MQIQIDSGVKLETPEGPGEALLIMLDEVFNIIFVFVRLNIIKQVKKFTWNQLDGFPNNYSILHKLKIRLEENY